jgi:hypothetical protein
VVLTLQLPFSVVAAQAAGAQVSETSVHTPLVHEYEQLPAPKPLAQVPEVSPLFVAPTSQSPFSVAAVHAAGPPDDEVVPDVEMPLDDEVVVEDAPPAPPPLLDVLDDEVVDDAPPAPPPLLDDDDDVVVDEIDEELVVVEVPVVLDELDPPPGPIVVAPPPDPQPQRRLDTSSKRTTCR